MFTPSFHLSHKFPQSCDTLNPAFSHPQMVFPPEMTKAHCLGGYSEVSLSFRQRSFSALGHRENHTFGHLFMQKTKNIVTYHPLNPGAFKSALRALYSGPSRTRCFFGQMIAGLAKIFHFPLLKLFIYLILLFFTNPDSLTLVLFRLCKRSTNYIVRFFCCVNSH